MRTTTAFCLVALLAACGDDLDAPLPDDDPATPTRSMTGTQVIGYRQLDRTLLGSEPVDLWDTVVEAQVPDGDGWRIKPGVGHRDGSFEIPGLPIEGSMWLRLARRPFGETFYWTDATHISFDESVLGAMEPVAANSGDQLVLDIDGLAAWEDSDQLAWFVPEDDVYDQNVVSPSPPAPGTTDLDGMPIDWNGRATADVRPGEPALIIQYRNQLLGEGIEIRAPLRSARTPIHQVPGTDGTIVATLAQPPALDYHLRWALDTFEAQRTAAHPTRAGASYDHGFAIVALPGMVDGELWPGSEYPVARLVDPSILEGTAPIDLGVVNLPNPFPRSWLVDLFVVTFPVEFPLPDGSPATLEAVLGQRSADLSTTAGPVTPMITPIRAPLIAGRDGHTELADVGTMPELSWSAPEIGTPTSHQLRIIEAITNPPPPFRPGWYVTAELIVPGDVTSIRVPADLLKRGTTYGVVVRTFAQPGQDVSRRPFGSRGTAGFADTILGPFTP